jgi:hypothetical protein
MVKAQRWVVGSVLIAHSLAHSMPGMRAMDGVPGWLIGQPRSNGLGLVIVAAVLLALAMGGLMAGGLGALRVSPFSRAWRRLAVLGAAASLALFIQFRPPLALSGALVSVALIAVVPWLREEGPSAATLSSKRHWARLLTGTVGMAAVGYIAIAILARPWHIRWGSTTEELSTTLPGDELVKGPVEYGIQHAVTIDAPPAAVWPWLVQLGQDRAGFYSHDWLERLFGVDIRNGDHIVQEWQHLEVGDSVFATQPGYLGLFEQRLGWRIAALETGRAMVLEKWGAFVIVPVGQSASRLIVRTRGGDVQPASILDILIGPVGLLAFELPHFIMERGMLLGIKARAEAGRIRDPRMFAARHIAVVPRRIRP